MVFSVPWLPSSCGKKPFSLKLFMYSEMNFGVEFYDLISLLVINCSSPAVSIAETLFKMHIGEHLICVKGVSNNISVKHTQPNQLKIASGLRLE
jgi:hypothetical protein